MSLSSALGKFTRGLFAQVPKDSVSPHELARRIEERAQFTRLEAQAYIDHRLESLADQAPLTGEHLERRGLLATQEARAYADQAVGSISLAVRGIANAVVELKRMQETQSRELERLQFQVAKAGNGIEERLARLQSEVVSITTSPFNGGGGSDLNVDLARIDGAFRQLQASLIGIDEAVREVDCLLSGRLEPKNDCAATISTAAENHGETSA